MRVEYSTTPLSLSIDSRTVNDLDAYPCEIRLHSKLRNKGDLDSYTEKTIRAKYVIGADGAKSWTRKQLGFTMDGTRTGSIWGVMDAIVVSNFPE
jgi:phenol 2-monooxygenase